MCILFVKGIIMKSLNNIEQSTVNLVNTLQTLSSDDETIFGFLRALKHANNTSKFFTLFNDAINPLALRLRKSDLRTEASLNLLLQLSHNKPMLWDAKTVNSFCTSVCNNHPTLVQSFFRLIKNAIYTLENPSIYITLAKKHANSELANKVSLATNELLNSLTATPQVTEDDTNNIIKKIDSVRINIPFI